MGMQKLLTSPARPIEPGIHKLSALDQVMWPIYIPGILCFELPGDRPSHEEKWRIFCRLRDGLSHALAEFPVYSGNVVKDEASNKGGVCIRISEGSGVDTFNNDLTSSLTQNSPLQEFAAIKAAHFPLEMLPKSPLFPPTTIGVQPSGPRPCLAVQVNFIDGGLILVAVVHHQVSDGTGLSLFFDHWASETKKVGSINRPQINGLEPEILERDFVERLACQQFLTQTLDNRHRRERLSLPEIWTDHSHAATTQTAQGNDGDKILTTYWVFYPDKLQSLKREASVGHDPQPGESHPYGSGINISISTGDAVLAFLRLHINVARQIPAHVHTTLCILVNIRNRLDPPLHPKYVGNAALPLLIPQSRHRLPVLDDPKVEFRKTAAAHRHAINLVDSQYIRNMLLHLHALPSWAPFECIDDLDRNLACTSHSSFPYYDLDWGSPLGRIERYRPGLGYGNDDGMLLLLPRRRDGALEVVMCLRREVVERLEGDAGFREYADLLFR